MSARLDAPTAYRVILEIDRHASIFNHDVGLAETVVCDIIEAAATLGIVTVNAPKTGLEERASRAEPSALPDGDGKPPYYALPGRAGESGWTNLGHVADLEDD